MTEVYIKEGETIETALKRFNKKMNESRVLVEAKQRREYVKPSDRKRRERAAGQARQRKKQAKIEKQLQFLDTHKFPVRGASYGNMKKDADKTIYVGSLPYTTTENELQEHIETAVLVKSTKIIYDRETGKSKGFGFVELYDQQDVKVAVEELNGKDLQGRKLVINPNDQNKKNKKPRHNSSNEKQDNNSEKPIKFKPEEKEASEESLKGLRSKFSAKTG